MNIAIVVGVFPKLSETFILADIITLLKWGHDVRIFAFTPSKEDTKIHPEISKYQLLKRTRYIKNPSEKWKIILQGVCIIIKGLFYQPKAILKCMNFKKYTKSEIVNNLFKLEPFLSKKYDIVHCHFGTNALDFLFLKDMLDIKFVTTFHGYDISSKIKEMGDNFYHELFAKGDLFLPVSEYFRERLIDLGCPKEKIKVLYYGIDLDKFGYVERSFKFTNRIKLLTVGRLVEKKGISYAIDAIRRLIKQYKNIEYCIIGNGKQKALIKTLISAFNLNGFVKILDGMTHEEVRNHFYQSDIFILPSITVETGDQEGIPTVLKEAMATGMPVVSTFHSGIPELVADGKSGFLTRERDSQGLAEKLSFLIENPSLCKEMAQNGRRIIEEKFNADQIHQELVTTYQELSFNGKRKDL